MAVGACLHDGHVIFPFGRLLDDIQVMADGPEVYFGPGAGRAGCWHDSRMAERLEKRGAPDAPGAGNCPSLAAQFQTDFCQSFELSKDNKNRLALKRMAV